MYKTTKDWQWTRVGMDAILASLGAATPTFTFDGCKVNFAQNDFVDDGADTAVAAMTVADFDGYATKTLGAIGASTPPMNGPLNVDSGNIGINVSITEECTADQDPSQQIYGAYLTDSTGASLYGFEKFADVAPIINDGDFLQYDLVLALPLTITLAT